MRPVTSPIKLACGRCMYLQEAVNNADGGQKAGRCPRVVRAEPAVACIRPPPRLVVQLRVGVAAQRPTRFIKDEWHPGQQEGVAGPQPFGDGIGARDEVAQGMRRSRACPCR